MAKVGELLNHIKAHSLWVNLMFALLFIAFCAGGWFIYQHMTSLYNQVALLEDRLASTTATLQGNIEETRVALSADLTREQQALRGELGLVEQRVGSVSGTVSTLQKLSETDPELLQKYSKVFFLNEHYAPERVEEIPNRYEYDESRHTKIHAKVWPYLQNLLEDAEQSGLELYTYSGYRPFSEQAALKQQYTITYGEGTANQFSADQGYSEHQLGTTIDFITTDIDGTLQGFDETNEYQWLQNNAHKYGFVLSYPEGNEHYVFEPWHWRFVGVDLATDLHQQNAYFYDWEQRKIDEYLVNVFE